MQYVLLLPGVYSAAKNVKGVGGKRATTCKEYARSHVVEEHVERVPRVFACTCGLPPRSLAVHFLKDQCLAGLGDLLRGLPCASFAGRSYMFLFLVPGSKPNMNHGRL